MLPKESLDLVEKWIAGGALENAGSKAIIISAGLSAGAVGAILANEKTKFVSVVDP